MTTIFYTKNSVVQYIQSDGVSIPVDERNRDYRRITAQDAITPFERVEIPEPPAPGATIEEQIAEIKAILDDTGEIVLDLALGV